MSQVRSTANVMIKYSWLQRGATTVTVVVSARALPSVLPSEWISGVRWQFYWVSKWADVACWLGRLAQLLQSARVASEIRVGNLFIAISDVKEFGVNSSFSGAPSDSMCIMTDHPLVDQVHVHQTCCYSDCVVMSPRSRVWRHWSWIRVVAFGPLVMSMSPDIVESWFRKDGHSGFCCVPRAGFCS